jgi:hypothetical protein
VNGWDDFEPLTYNGGYEFLYNTKVNYTGNFFGDVITNASGQITGFVGSSLNMSLNPLLTLVDNVDTQPGEGVINSSEDMMTIYLNPKDNVKNFEIVYSGSVNTEQGESEFNQTSYSLEVAAKTYDAIVSTSTTAATDNTAATITKLTGDVTIDLWDKGDVAAKASVAVDAGEISIENTVTFDTVKLSAADAYDFDISITDAIAVLRDIVNLDNLSGNAFHAADVNNDGNISITDAIAVLRDIVNLDTIDTFDIIDAEGNLVTQLDASAQGAAPTWTLVANGDVNMSGGFDDAYVVTSEIV